MSRGPEEVRAALATAAGLVTFDTAGHTWRDVLFTGPDEADLSRPDDPDRALLAALAEEYPRLDEHGDTLPGRLHLDWLEHTLAIPRLPVVPDTVVAHATVDPALAPVVLPRGTVLRGGKDAFGTERRYTTDDPLTVHGATVLGVRTLVPGGDPTGLPGTIATGPDPDSPLDPRDGDPAPHRLRLSSPVLAFSGGTMTVEVTFTKATGAMLTSLKDAVWRHPRADGTVAVVTGDVGATGVTVVLTGSCAADDGDPWLEVCVPPHVALPTGFTFTAAHVQVVERGPIVPQAAYVNDGAVDVTKEFEPFGAAAKRGDALYLRSDEAFGKPLATVTIDLEIMQEGTPGHMMFALIFVVPQWSTGANVAWQRYIDGTWQTFRDVGPKLTGVTKAPLSGPVASEPTVIGGLSGHLVRAFLSQGDFGWTQYQKDIAAFATDAVAGRKPTMPTPPVPPVVSRLTLRYTTPAVRATVEARNGWATTRPPAVGTFAPFTRALSPTGGTGMVAVGLDVPGTVTGATVCVHVGVESATACGSSAAPASARWEWWDGGAWRDLAVADGTSLLRESGLLRFVAPPGWAVGCSDVTATTGRWVRMVTDTPDLLGTLTSITPDAVVATYTSQARDPQTDPTPTTPLPPGALQGTVTAIPGVKITNLAGTRGRGPEDDTAYRRRAATLTRHRGRAVTAWDYEEIVADAFPEVAAVRCLPHTGPAGERAPGHVGLLVLPDAPDERMPRPSVSLAGRITDLLTPLSALHARPAVLCPLYVPVTVAADVVLRPGVAALTGRDAITEALRARLHPATAPVRWGRALFRSSLEAFLDGLPQVDTVRTVTLLDADRNPTEVVEVDPCRGLFCSSDQHTITVKEQL